jgi:ribosomal protein S1
LPPPPDEGYWSALLHEGEFSEAGSSSNEVDVDLAANYASDLQYDSLATHDNSGIESDWAEIQRLMENDEVIELSVISYNRGGLLVEWRTLHGFVPASQLTDFGYDPRHRAPKRPDVLLDKN